MTREARDIVVTGRVQGVGYRPFVYRTAHELGLAGTVLNGSGKVFIHAEGPAATLDRLERALVEQAPPLARPRLASSEEAALSGASTFAILASDAASEPEIHLPPDLFTCADCLAELTGPAERRYGYPFINCTQCGPRYTIITAMPYDRPNTSMAGFPLCDACRAEYESPLDRRFHAQPLACSVCGPRLEFVPVVGARARRRSGGASSPAAKPHLPHSLRLVRDRRGPIPEQGSVLQQTIAALDAGQVVAVKGVGGYHLLCDAANDAAVHRLRERKHRPHKPLAVMFPLRGADGLDAAREHLRMDAVSAAALLDPARPIVLAPMAESFRLSPSLAPGLAELGAFLPYSPLHHELLAAFGRPLVATSGNISGEPVITANAEAQQRLAGIADAFLHHDRPIVRPADDPVVRPMAGAARTLRLGRGLAPLELELPESRRLSRPLLATGGHLKVTVALAWDRRVVVSPHIGELDSLRSNDIFNQIIKDIQELYDVKAEAIICDRHPGYASTRWARQQGLPVLEVQHHAAHASALAGEHPDVGRWLVFAWDGVGYGDDGSLWGGEALAGRPGAWRRRASFRPFRLVGGDRAGREPWRSAAALAWATGRELDGFVGDGIVGAALAAIEGESRLKPLPQPLLQLAHDAWNKNLNTHESSAVGRLFDAAAALVLGRQVASFEGQGPMELEAIAADGCRPLSLPLAADGQGVLRSDWAPLLEVLTDGAMAPAERAGIFHETLAQALLDQARAIRATTDFDAVGLSGGVFQNRRLTERVVALLGQAGIDARLHREVPANDGGLSFGQVIEAMQKM
jgi:hydrogenase maturation protein HypF